MDTLSAYRVPPMMERKAAQELREAGSRAYLPRDRNDPRRSPIARGYVFTNYKPAFAKHVRSKVGDCSRAEVLRICTKLRRQERNDNPFKPGDTAIKTVGKAPVQVEIQVTVSAVSGRVCLIAWEMMGKTHQQSIHYTQLRPG
jgi:hypothetical protein